MGSAARPSLASVLCPPQAQACAALPPMHTRLPCTTEGRAGAAQGLWVQHGRQP